MTQQHSDAQDHTTAKSISVYCLVSNSVLVLQEWKLDPRTPAMSRFFSLQHGHEILAT